MTLSGSLSYAENKPTVTIPEAELLRLRADRAFLMDAADELTVRLESCEEMLEMSEENPPECDGFPWLECVVSALVGAVTVALVD